MHLILSYLSIFVTQASSQLSEITGDYQRYPASYFHMDSLDAREDGNTSKLGAVAFGRVLSVGSKWGEMLCHKGRWGDLWGGMRCVVSARGVVSVRAPCVVCMMTGRAGWYCVVLRKRFAVGPIDAVPSPYLVAIIMEQSHVEIERRKRTR
jgi:hypothetical protein